MHTLPARASSASRTFGRLLVSATGIGAGLCILAVAAVAHSAPADEQWATGWGRPGATAMMLSGIALLAWLRRRSTL